MASALRRTDELQRLKTRNLILQNTNASYPIAGAIVYIDSSMGHVGTSTGITISGTGDITTTGNIACNNITASGGITAAGNIACDNINASGTITTPEDIICRDISCRDIVSRNITALDPLGNDNEFTTFSIKRTGTWEQVGRIATSGTDEVFIEGVRYTRFTGINNGYGQNTMIVDVCAGVVTVNAGATGGLVVNRQAGASAAALTVNGGSVLRTTGVDNQISTTEIWSNSGYLGGAGERQIGRLATDGDTVAAPTGIFYVQGERFVTLTTIDNTPGTMPVYVDVSEGQTNINGTLVLNPIGATTPYGGVTIASPLFSASARTGTMCFTGTTLYIKTTSGGVNGWRIIDIL